ncbi:hypothetical protein EW146_g10269, partial [Bondarzewia mesenterica]
GSQYGKVAVIRNSDYVANHSTLWWESSKYNIEAFDIHLCAYNAELRVMYDFMGKVYSDVNHPTGLNKVSAGSTLDSAGVHRFDDICRSGRQEIDIEQLATETDDKLQSLRTEWFARLAKMDETNAQHRFRTGLLRLAYSYARLITLSYGFQHAFSKSDAEDHTLLTRCIRAASDVVSAMVDDIGIPSQSRGIYLRHGPEAQTVFVAFGCTFLIKLLQPKYTRYITPERRKEIIDVVQRAVDFLNSPDIAIDDRHVPRLYSRFIGGLLESVRDQSSSTSPHRLSQRMSTKAKSSPPVTPDNEQQFLPTSMSSLAYLGHPPSQLATAVNPHALVSSGADYFLQVPQNTLDAGALGIATSDLFRQPLPFEPEFLQSIQSLTSLSDMMPGFGWMDQMPPLDNALQPAGMIGFQY